jgi:hypothetical protein
MGFGGDSGMSAELTPRTRGRIWFEALAGKHAKLVPSVSSVLVADTMLQNSIIWPRR